MTCSIICQVSDTSLSHIWSMRGPFTFTPVSGILMLLKPYRETLRQIGCPITARFIKETTDKYSFFAICIAYDFCVAVHIVYRRQLNRSGMSNLCHLVVVFAPRSLIPITTLIQIHFK